MADAWDGRPKNPERDGWHWVMPARGIGITSPRLWHAQIARWEMLDGTLSFATEAAEMWRYVAPCITPDEVAAREAAAAEAMRAAIVAEGNRIDAMDGNYSMSIRDVIDAAERVPIPAADALARALDQARAEEREACAQWRQKAAEDAVLAPDYGGQGDLARGHALQDAAAAIRARGKETPHDR